MENWKAPSSFHPQMSHHHHSYPLCPLFRCPCRPPCLHHHHHHHLLHHHHHLLHHHPSFCPFHSRFPCPNFQTHFPNFPIPPPPPPPPPPNFPIPNFPIPPPPPPPPPPNFPIPPPPPPPPAPPANLNPSSSLPGVVDTNFSATGLQEADGELYEEEEEEEPVFVLTDEWMEFFAKSEAKRRLEKKQAQKRGGK